MMFVGNLLQVYYNVYGKLVQLNYNVLGKLVQVYYKVFGYYDYSQTNDQLRTRYVANDKWKIKISLGKQINK